MTEKFFTVEEANRLLPRIRKMMEELFVLRKQALAMRPDVWPMLEKAKNNGGSQKAGELLEIFSRFQELAHELQGMGCELKGVDPGLVDCPALRGGQKIYLCWLYDEPEIAYWHHLDAGFAGRQPL